MMELSPAPVRLNSTSRGGAPSEEMKGMKACWVSLPGSAHDSTVLLMDETNGAYCRISLLGGTLLELALPSSPGSSDLAEIFQTQGVGSAGLKLIPWPNRVDNGEYELPPGKKHQLPINETARNNAIHGLLPKKTMQVNSLHCTENVAQALLSYRFDGKDEGYPFELYVEVNHRLVRGAGLTVTTTAYNVGKEPLPFGDGWHPYVKLLAKSEQEAEDKEEPTNIPLDDLYLTVTTSPPSTSSQFEELLVNERMIPTGERSAWAGMQQQSLSGLSFDTGFFVGNKGSSTASNNNKVLCKLSSSSSSTPTIVLWQEQEAYPYLQIYTPPNRRSIALEPMSMPTNGFNTGEFLELQPLAEGEERREVLALAERINSCAETYQLSEEERRRWQGKLFVGSYGVYLE
ncbi:Aldose 1-epimerase [Balamuthia mandrillaris]